MCGGSGKGGTDSGSKRTSRSVSAELAAAAADTANDEQLALCMQEEENKKQSSANNGSGGGSGAAAHGHNVCALTDDERLARALQDEDKNSSPAAARTKKRPQLRMKNRGASDSVVCPISASHNQKNNVTIFSRNRLHYKS
jgi:hypothetical protein